MSKLLEESVGFNEAQETAIEAGPGIFKVLAGPGSGKTAVLVERYKRLCKFGFYPVCLTFTKAAANEMKERSGGGNFRTIHSMAYHFLRTLCVPSSGFVVPPLDELVSHATEILWRSPHPFKYVMIDEAQDCSAKDWDFISLLSSNIFAVGDAMQCQPAGTKVLCLDKKGSGRTSGTFKEVDIATLRDGDQVLSWTHHEQRVYQVPRKISVASRQYEGTLLTIRCGGKETSVTPDHKMWVRFSRHAFEAKPYFVYLMYRSDRGFRIGISHFRRASGSNQLGNRLSQENAERLWILKVVDTRSEAEMWEEILSLQYQIPESVFNADNCARKTEDQVSTIFLSVPRRGGFKCLEEFGLLFDSPLLAREQANPEFNARNHKFRGYFRTSACNVLAEVMELPLPQTNKSAAISGIISTPFSGKVYSLDVEKDHTYVADGLVVGNCLYGFRNSKPELFLHMENMFPETKTLYLGQNYRSTQKIVEFCKEIAPIRGALLEKMCSQNENGEPVSMLSFDHNVAEAEFVIHRARELEQAGDKDSAVLARTNKQLEVFIKLHASEHLDLKTIHAAKGQEWDNVFVIGTQQGLMPFKDGDIDEEARILFVAASRAKKRLTLTRYGTQSRLVLGPGRFS